MHIILKRPIASLDGKIQRIALPRPGEIESGVNLGHKQPSEDRISLKKKSGDRIVAAMTDKEETRPLVRIGPVMSRVYKPDMRAKKERATKEKVEKARQQARIRRRKECSPWR